MIDTTNFNFDSFSHGQILSKLWLCQQLEPHLLSQQSIAVLGCWYNTLALMLKIRGNNQYIVGYDHDPHAIAMANRICDSWCLDGTVRHQQVDVNGIDFEQFDVIINTSSEHMNGHWFDRVNSGTLICIQSSDITDRSPPWLVTNPVEDFNDFVNKYRLSQTLYTGKKFFDYGKLTYHRFMIIGIK
jgi:hypothetical protein